MQCIHEHNSKSLMQAALLALLGFAIALCATFVAMVPQSAFAANETTVTAVNTSTMGKNLSATVTYDPTFAKGKTTRFTYNVTGNTQPLQYRLFSFDIQRDGSWVTLVDASRGDFTSFSDNNYYDIELTSPGTYRLMFNAGEYTVLDNGGKYIPTFARFSITFTVAETADRKSMETIVKEVSAQCLSECAGSDDYTKALWLNDWLIDHVEYDSTLMFASAESAFTAGKGTCEAYHDAYVLLLRAVGIETRRVDSTGDNHVWTGVKLDGKWYNVDTTWNDSSSTYGGIDMRHLYFALPSSVMRMAHQQWDGTYEISYLNREAFDAESYEDNYFIRSGEISKFSSSYLATSETYSVKPHLDARETSFSIPVVNGHWPDNYKNVIYSLVAYSLEQHNWGDGISVSVGYSNGSLDFRATYGTSTPATSISDAMILGVDNVTYTGGAHTPSPTVVLNGKTLVKDKDYSVSYSNNTNASTSATASVTITGKGNYFSTTTKSFRINPADISNASFAAIANQQYTGKAITPTPTVTFNGKKLVAGTDYTLTYRNNVNAGTATIVVTGKGNFLSTSSKELNFTIVKPASSSSSSSTKPSTSSSTAQSSPANTVVTGTWVRSGGRWWFSYDAKTKAAQKKAYPANEWVTIGGRKYHFDNAGWMHSYWLSTGGAWYWLGSDGAMRTGWSAVGGVWYYMASDGKMVTGKQDNIGGQTYFFNSSGAMLIGWVRYGSSWYYCWGSGAMAKNSWLSSGGRWYFLSSTGVMVTGKQDNIGGQTYFFNSSGAMLTGWVKYGSSWYYCWRSGAMARNCWIGNYYVGSNGVMATNSWVDNGKYYVDGNGVWVPGKRR